MENVILAWHIWFFFAAVLFIAEMLTGTFVLLFFGISCTISAMCAAVGLGASIQWSAFCIVSSMTILFFMLKKKSKSSPRIANSERLLGLIGIVIKEIPEFGSGAITVKGEEWAATSEDHGQIAKDTKVLIKEISGVKLIVSKEI